MNLGVTNTKTNLNKTIKNKQQLYKRFCRRFKTTNNPSERTFLKQEINHCIKELKQCAVQWKKNGFGSNGWVTKGYNTVSLTNTGSWSGTGSKKSYRTSSKYSKPTRFSRTGKSKSSKTRGTHAGFSFPW